jgi:hypothetical protein
MKQVRISKRRRPADQPAELLPLDPRDRDIVRAKQLARSQSDSVRHARRRPELAPISTESV